MIREWVEQLLALTDQDWRNYSFSRDPLSARITPEMQAEHGQKTVACALDLAGRLRADCGTQTPEQISVRLGVKLLDQKIEVDASYTMFAWYEEPDTIVISRKNLLLTDELRVEENLDEFVGTVSTADIVIGHELYHFLEKTMPGIYSTKEHITLWKIGPVENRSRIVSLEEIGAMAFTRELTGLKCSPYIVEFIMLCALNLQRAKNLYEHLISLQAVQKGL